MSPYDVNHATSVNVALLSAVTQPLSASRVPAKPTAQEQIQLLSARACFLSKGSHRPRPGQSRSPAAACWFRWFSPVPPNGSIILTLVKSIQNN